jgi:hypothetical protein
MNFFNYCIIEDFDDVSLIQDKTTFSNRGQYSTSGEKVKRFLYYFDTIRKAFSVLRSAAGKDSEKSLFLM